MEKFELNKRVIARMERPEMADVKGGFTYLISGERGSYRGKRCCGPQGFHLRFTLFGLEAHIGGGPSTVRCEKDRAAIAL